MRLSKNHQKLIVSVGVLFLAISIYLNVSDSTPKTLIGQQSDLKQDANLQKKKFTKADRIQLAFQQEFVKTYDPSLGLIPRERLKSGQEMIANRASSRQETKAVTLSWTERGPDNVGGRTKAIMWDPNDGTNKKAWAGAASGGLWYNNDVTNVATSWVAVNDQMENLSVTAIAYDPTNTNTMYVGTGEGHIIGSVRGAGMFKSTDGGATWTHMTTTNGFYDTESNFHYVNDVIVVNEGGTGVLYVATQESLNNYTYQTYSKSGARGIWRSTDGGVTFTQYQSFYSIGDFEVDSDGRIYAGTAQDLTNSYTARIFYSDNGTTWNTAYDPGTGNRVELAIAPSDPGTIYAVASDGSAAAWMVKNTDADNNPGAGNWASITIPPHFDPTNGAAACGSLSCSASGDFTRDSQAFYDLILRVDPTDASKVWVGGIDLHQSTNGGTSWSPMTSWVDINGFGCSCRPYVHADQHVLEFNPNDNSQLLSGSDGGVFLITSAGAGSPTFSERNLDYNVTQFYGGAIHPTASTDHFLAGAQDNGTQRFSAAGKVSTTQVSGGDGAYCNIDQDEPTYQWTQYVYSNFYRSTNSGSSFSGIPEFGSSTGRFINPSRYDDTQNIMYAAGANNQFLRWTNPQSGSTGSFITSIFGDAQVSAITISPNVSNRVYFGTGGQYSSSTGGGKLYYVNNANSSNTSVDISDASFPANSYLSSIDIESGDENHIVVTFSNYGVSSVWETTDGGTNWTEVEGDLPDMPVRWVLIHPDDATRIFLATELGVWSTDNTNGALTDWSPHDDESFPHVRTDMLQVRTSDNEMIAITHGRGLWSTNIDIPASSDPEISFTTSADSQSEVTNVNDGCKDYTDYTVSMKIINPPTGDATVTLAVDGASTGSLEYDYAFTTTGFASPTNTLTFANGSTANQSFALRIYNDEAIESSETVIFNYAITGSTDAIAGSSNQTYTFTISDDEIAPAASSINYLLQEDFESYANYTALTSAGWSQGNFGSNASTWTLGAAGAQNGTKGLFISDDGTNNTYDVDNNSSMGMITPIMDATGVTGMTLGFNYVCNGEVNSGTYYDYGRLLYIVDANDNGNIFDDGSFSVFATNIQGITSTTAYSISLPAAVEGTKFAVGFLWTNDNSVGSQPPWAVDDVVISAGSAGSTIASTQNQTYEANFGPDETIHFYDDSSGEIMLSLENLSSWDYGCTTVSLSSAGTGAMTMNGTTSQYYPMDKTFDITPTSNNASGSYTATMYYTASEISGWIASTGNTINDLEIIKVEGTFDSDVLSNDLTWEAATPTLTSFGSNHAIEVTFNTGFSSFGGGDSGGWSAPLPVDLITFMGKRKDTSVELLWQTATEENSEYFGVEWSINGIDYEEIGTVSSSGNSTALLSYGFLHKTPQFGVNYYRLNAVDFDGYQEYSKTVVIEVRPSPLSLNSIHPNPASDKIDLTFASEVPNVQIQLISMDGKIIRQIQHSGDKGIRNQGLNIADCKKGIYLIRISDGFSSDVEKIIIR